MASHITITRRNALQLFAGSAALPFMKVGAAAAADQALTAAVTGYTVVNTFDPGQATQISENYIIWGVFNSLLKFNAKMEIVPDLAENFKVVDPTTLEFKLRRNVKFHDGNEMTADDVKFTLERLMDEKFASPNRAKLASIEAVNIIDPYTVSIVTKTPFAPLLAYLTNTRTGTQIVSRKAVEALGADFAAKPVGTGAYKIKEWQSGIGAELEAFDDYFGGAPKVKRISVPLIAEDASGMTALLAGQVHLTATVPFADVASLEQRNDVTVYKQSGMNTRYVSLNTRKAPFDDPAFRRALSMAFDRDAIVKAVVFGEGVPTAGLLPPTLTAPGTQELPALATYDPERARAELAKSKYGVGTEGTVLILGNWMRRIGELFVAQVNQTLGLKLKPEVMDGNALFARLRSGDFDAALWGWTGLIDQDEYLGDILGKDASRNYQGYHNEQFQSLIEKGRTELDFAKRQEIYQQAEAVMLEDMPVIPCFCSNIQNLSVKNLEGFEQFPYGNYGDQFANLELR